MYTHDFPILSLELVFLLSWPAHGPIVSDSWTSKANCPMMSSEGSSQVVCRVSTWK